MKRTAKEIDEKLLDYIDGRLDEAESMIVEKSIQEDELIQKRFEEIRNINAILLKTSLQEPSGQFTQKVMGRLNELPRRAGLSIKKSIFLFLGMIITIGVSTLLVTAGVFDNTANINLNDMVIQKDLLKQPLPSIQFDGKTVVNVIIVLNIILAFIVLDRTILKPWFENRRRLNTWDMN